jgi:hypothetical protein
MNQLASALDAVAASGKGTEDSLAGVNAKYASVVEQMKTAVGSPWIAGDVQNTKNYAEALQAVTPALKEVSSAFYTVFGGLATAKSEIVKWIAESGIAKVAIKGLALVIGGLVTVLSVMGAVKLAFWLKSASQAFSNVAGMATTASAAVQRWTGSVWLANAAARATTIGVNLLNFALKAMGVVAILSMLASLYGMYKNWSSASDDVAKETQGVADATRQMNEALQEQIDKIDSIVTRQAALRASLKEVTDSWAAYYAAISEGKDPAIVENLRKKAVSAEAKSKEAAEHPVGRDPADVAREDADAESRKRSEYERAMAVATPEEQKDLMSAEGARRSALGKEGGEEAGKNEATRRKQADIDLKINAAEASSSPAEKARLLRIATLDAAIKDSNLPMAESKLERSTLISQGPADATEKKLEIDKLKKERIKVGKGGLLGSGGLLSEAEAHLQEIAYSESSSTKHLGGMYSDLSDEDRLKEKENWQKQKSRATRLQSSYLQNESEGASMTQQSGQAGKAISSADQIAAVNQRIADSKETGYNLTLQELAAQQEILAIESLKEGLSKADKEGKVEKIKLIQKQIDAASRAHDTEVRQNKASLATSTIRGEGYEVEKQKDAIERKRLVAEEAAAVGDEAKMKAKAALEAHDTMRSGKEVAQYESAGSLDEELSRSRAQARGDSARVTEIGDFEEFRKNFDARKGVMGLDQAKRDAQEMALNTITLRAQSDMNSSNAGVASASMARIGGGGGIGPGATSMIDLQKRTNDLLVSADGHLADIKAKRDGIPAN